MRKRTYNICIPVFNEEENLHALIENLHNFVKNKSVKNTFNIVFYDDGSTDDTLKTLDKYEDIFVIEGVENKGLGHSIKALLNYSVSTNVDGVFKIDGDNQMKIDEISNFLNHDDFLSTDVIYGNRFNSNLKYTMPKLRKLGSVFFKYLLKVFGINISDPTNGFVYMSKKYLNDYKIVGSYNAAQQILIDAKLRSLKIAEVDITIENRSVGNSFIGIKYPVIVISNIIALLLFRRTMRYLISPGLIIFLSGIILLLINVINWITGDKQTIITDDILILLIIVGMQLAFTGFLIEIYKNQGNK
jgi:glycosyltransferase involved in cell wall biosynthesis|tara:strand:+ start:3525 stop:4430 length:906 start_codon:yes stop_codon:yes gene_type:complete